MKPTFTNQDISIQKSGLQASLEKSEDEANWAFSPPQAQSAGPWEATALQGRDVHPLHHCLPTPFPYTRQPHSLISLGWLQTYWPLPATWYPLHGWEGALRLNLGGGRVVDGRTKPGLWNQICQNVDNGCHDSWGYKMFSASFYLLFCAFQIFCNKHISFVIKNRIKKKTNRKNLK